MICGLELHPDGTLELNMENAARINSVIIYEPGEKNRSFFYPEGDMVSRKSLLNLLETWEKVSDYNESEKNFIRCFKFEVMHMGECEQ